MANETDQHHSVRTVPVGPAQVLDATTDQVVQEIVALCLQRGPAVRTAYALHVGGLNLVKGGDACYEAGLSAANLVYADGAAVVLLARVGGARQIQRAPTTDIGVPVIRGLGVALGRPAKVALVGGPPGLAESAGKVLASGAGAEVLVTADGYRRDDHVLIEELVRAAPDLLIVGMGVPTEVKWVERLKSHLPSTTVLTCGGWFNFLTGEERRAPTSLQRFNLEWVHRLMLAPRRLAPRYLRGVSSTLRLLPRQMHLRRQVV